MEDPYEISYSSITLKVIAFLSSPKTAAEELV
jgi:hypothetical protein